ncbi:MAG: hypothetical protein FJ154_09510 [Gammaproteobacteria bacterium]|nr:hypothetical protein [Gammaproteobacteria bacterium]MBM4233244.1 hypothetical protein [Gammaproteobacteria bacterium]MBM4239752.1 hypothetical protein [Gammaproteobacteria bacterium]
MASDVSWQLESLEPLILAALDELRAPDESGVTQVVALTELRLAIENLERRDNLPKELTQRISDAREMYERLAEVSSLRQGLSNLLGPRSVPRERRH